LWNPFLWQRARLLSSGEALIPTLLPEGEGQDTEPLLKPSPFGRWLGEGFTRGELSSPALTESGLKLITLKTNPLSTLFWNNTKKDRIFGQKLIKTQITAHKHKNQALEYDI
jgi:hypothetical protein